MEVVLYPKCPSCGAIVDGIVKFTSDGTFLVCTKCHYLAPNEYFYGKKDL